MKKHNYYGFENWADVVRQFYAKDEDIEPELVYAVYSTPSYEGSADVIYRRDDKWFHVSGSHCSCFGLENQWEPETIDPNTHLMALVDNKKELLVSDSQGDYPDATQENFDNWLKWAVTQ